MTDDGTQAAPCSHLDQVRDVTPSAEGCEDCLRIGSSWVHLRMCLSCGHAGCCDSSPNRHASAHFRATSHPLVRSLEPGEDWMWCYVDEVGMILDDSAPQRPRP
jgi:uncharacterized UBP type Zn finger protein